LRRATRRADPRPGPRLFLVSISRTFTYPVAHPDNLRSLAPLAGKSAIVTGASSGIGAAIARALRGAGAKVAAGARRTERLDADVALELDVRSETSSMQFVARALKELGGLDILVNNAGLGLGRDPFEESSEEDEATVVETNVLGLMRMTRLCLHQLRDGGHIVNVGSIAGRQAYENAAVYVASKFAVRGFTYALREDLLGRPIRLTLVDPGLVESEFSIVRFRGDREEAKKPYEGVEPLTPDDIAECVVFALTRPLHVNVDEIVIKALRQSSPTRIVRDEA
jgi:NADP-dependent 3-hydroxy acid dehydrogenase YdfG